MEHKNDDFLTQNTVANDDRAAAAVAFSCRQLKFLKAFV